MPFSAASARRPVIPRAGHRCSVGCRAACERRPSRSRRIPRPRSRPTACGHRIRSTTTSEPPLGRVATLYLGAAGVIWALQALERGGVTPSSTVTGARSRVEPAGSLPRGAGTSTEDGVTPSLWVGEAGQSARRPRGRDRSRCAGGAAPSRRFEPNVANADDGARRGARARDDARCAGDARADGGAELGGSVARVRGVASGRRADDELWRQRDPRQSEPRAGARARLRRECPRAGRVAASSIAERRAELERRTSAAIAHHAQRANGQAQSAARTRAARTRAHADLGRSGATEPPGIVASRRLARDRDDDERRRRRARRRRAS